MEIKKTLNELAVLCPKRQIVVLKELTKIYESTYRGAVLEVLSSLDQSKIKGEFVIILNGKN